MPGGDAVIAVEERKGVFIDHYLKSFVEFIIRVKIHWVMEEKFKPLYILSEVSLGIICIISKNE